MLIAICKMIHEGETYCLTTVHVASGCVRILELNLVNRIIFAFIKACLFIDVLNDHTV